MKNIIFSYICNRIFFFLIYMDITAYAVLLNIEEYKVLIFNVIHIKVACSKTVETLTNINLNKII